jgi:hypothetical protein
MKSPYLKYCLLLIFSIILCPVGAQSPLSRAIEKAIPAVFLIQTFDEDNNKLAIGSGFFIDSIGTGVTNYHVLAGATYATITLQDETVFSIENTVGQDPIKDLILFKVKRPETKKFEYLKISSKLSQLGEDVFTIGNPEGLSFSISNGIISSIRQDEMGEILQTTAPISPGSSGSPLLNMNGEVVGVVSFFLKNGQNLNFAISSKYILQIPKSNESISFPVGISRENIKVNIIDTIFKRFDWNATQYQIRANERSEFVSDEKNHTTGQPKLEYKTSIGGKSVKLNYSFQGGFLNSIEYIGDFGTQSHVVFESGSTLEEVLDCFVNITLELVSAIGDPCGCANYSYYYYYDYLWSRDQILQTKRKNCISLNEFSKNKIFSMADSVFRVDNNYHIDNKISFKKEENWFRYLMLFENNDSHYEMQLNYFQMGSSLRKYGGGESDFLLKITPKRKDVICEDK